MTEEGNSERLNNLIWPERETLHKYISHIKVCKSQEVPKKFSSPKYNWDKSEKQNGFFTQKCL